MIVEALGIEVGDKVMAMCGKYFGTEYRVESINGPFYWTSDYIAVIIWPYPVISLGLKSWNYPKDNTTYGINNIHRDGDRWFTDQGDEVFVQKTSNKKPLQINLFNQIESEYVHVTPYQFQPGVDYSDQNKVFKCDRCSLDFNGDVISHRNPYCPVCGFRAGVSKQIIVMDRVEPGKIYHSSYQRSLGCKAGAIEIV